MSTEKPISPSRHSITITAILCWAGLCLADQLIASAQLATTNGDTRQVVTPRSTPRPVTTLAAGTKVDSVKTNGRWNHLLLLATPKIHSGDVAKLSDTVRQAATSLSLTVMVTIKSAKDQSGYELSELGVGYSVPIARQQTVITSATQSTLGADLGFIQRQVLSQNETRLAEVLSIVQTTTLAVFDAPGLMHRDGTHRNYTTRHLVWIDAKTGSSAMLVWLMGKDASGALRPANEPLRVVAPGTKEQRNVHVDGSAFRLGFPTERAFALEDLPPGIDIPWTRELAAIAALPSYNAAELAKLSAAINGAIRSARRTAKPQ